MKIVESALALIGRGGLQTARHDAVTPCFVLRARMFFDCEALRASSGGLETAAPCASVTLLTWYHSPQRFFDELFGGGFGA